MHLIPKDISVIHSVSQSGSYLFVFWFAVSDVTGMKRHPELQTAGFCDDVQPRRQTLLLQGVKPRHI